MQSRSLRKEFDKKNSLAVPLFLCRNLRGLENEYRREQKEIQIEILK
jgi:hypothetical protein